MARTPRAPAHEITLTVPPQTAPLVLTGCTCGWSAGLRESRRDAHDWFGRHTAVARRLAAEGYDVPGPDDIVYAPQGPFR